MDELVDALKKVLADTFAFRIKAQYYHWNVEGPDFHQYHGLFGDLYTEVDGAVDTVAEHIRTLDAYAPGSFGRYSQLTTIEDEMAIPKAFEMVSRLEADNQKVITSLMLAHSAAEAANKRGIVNFLEDRIDTHEKHGWMLRASAKRV